MASPILPGTGLGSGLDTGAIVKALVNADKAAKQGQIDRGTTTNTASISGIGTLKSLLATFQKALTDLGSTTTPQFTGYSATSSDPKVLTSTSSNTAVAGNYVVKVTSLATSSKVASAAFAGGATSAITPGTLTITQNGTSYPVTVGAGATLQSVRDSINSQYQASGLSANIVTDSFGSRLVLGSTATGAGSDISATGIPELAIDGTAPMAAVPTATSSGAIGGLAADAVFSVDGLAMTSKSNTIANTISGLSLTLTGAGTSTVNVATNKDGLKASIQKFVDAYNAVANAVTSLTKPSLDDDGKPTVPAALTGDPLPRSLLAAIRGPLSQTGAGDKLTVLSQLGITTDQKTGALNFDGTKFTAAMNDKKLGGEVQTLFTGTNGLIERMNNVIKPYTDTGGILDTRTTNLNVTKTRLTADQAALDRRVETLTAVLTKKYNDMDTLVGKLKATASNITSMFEAMTAQQKNS
ncbi:flagellar filament capping protein FliD [Pseudomonas sp. NPDC099000]|uniref:flagellar filament capping protein FliD n=1 Tax=Pseudomonas sp. NPDC099000 TaxID=3364488 RepID=UPI00383B2021